MEINGITQPIALTKSSWKHAIFMRKATLSWAKKSWMNSYEKWINMDENFIMKSHLDRTWCTTFGFRKVSLSLLFINIQHAFNFLCLVDAYSGELITRFFSNRKPQSFFVFFSFEVSVDLFSFSFEFRCLVEWTFSEWNFSFFVHDIDGNRREEELSALDLITVWLLAYSSSASIFQRPFFIEL